MPVALVTKGKKGGEGVSLSNPKRACHGLLGYSVLATPYIPDYTTTLLSIEG